MSAHASVRTTLLALAALVALATAACNEEADRSPCDDVISFEGDSYCIVIEEGFLESECPDAFPEGRDFGDVVVCTDGDEVPDSIEDELTRLGYLTETSCANQSNPDATYVSTDPDECAAGTTTCDDGATPFEDACGCGCVAPAGSCADGATRRLECNDCSCSGGEWTCTDNDCSVCPDPSDPDVTYASTDPEMCMLVDLACGETDAAFSNYCGCGCIAGSTGECVGGDTQTLECNECVCVDGSWACDTAECATCPDLDDPTVDWMGTSAEECAGIDFDCGAGQIAFDEWCGCGCADFEVMDCSDGETQTIDCNTCTCDGGRWDCTTDECTNPCLEACGVGCPAPEFMLCGDDGSLYCNECQMACYDVAPATDPTSCTDCPSSDDPGIESVVYFSTDPAECALIDTACPPNAIGFDNQCGCGCSVIAAPECTDGQTRTDGCIDCTCVGSYWDCNADACADREACLDSCPIDCPAVADQLCGADGGWYCDECELLCYAVDGARSDDVCDHCARPDGAEDVRWGEYTLPDGCTFDEFSTFTRVYQTALEFTADHGCDGVATDNDWLTWHVARVVFDSNPDASLIDVYAAGGRIVATMTGDVYCGGAAPQASVAYIVIPADGRELDVQTCAIGTCGHGPPAP